MKTIRYVAYLSITYAIFASATFAQAGVEESSPVDWFYVLRGFIFIFSSALGMVWLGRRIARNRK